MGIKRGGKIAIFLSGLFSVSAIILSLQGKLTSFFAGNYKLDGIDVSHYQGDIDWNMIEEQGIDFAFIKATEGSGHIDGCFEKNWQRAGQTSLLVGAYHFFSFGSNGDTQADHFIHTVGSLNGKLPPVIDVEYYGDKEKSPSSKREVQEQLCIMLEELEEYYHTKPVIYTTYKAYHDFIQGAFAEYPLWIRNVYYPPISLEWTFWQYTDKAVLDGYQGKEKYVDKNVFYGSEDELRELILESGHACMFGERRMVIMNRRFMA